MKTFREMLSGMADFLPALSVSPNFMVQRPQPAGTRVLPPVDGTTSCEVDRSEETPETLIFDKAEQAEDLEKMRSEYAHAVEENKRLESKLSGLGEEDRGRVQRRIDQGREEAKRLERAIKRAEDANSASSE